MGQPMEETVRSLTGVFSKQLLQRYVERLQMLGCSLLPTFASVSNAEYGIIRVPWVASLCQQGVLQGM